MRQQWLTYLILLLLSTSHAAGQEIITGLLVNRQLSSDQGRATLKNGKADDTLHLPFKDDFSYPGPYPSTLKWADGKVFVNNTFSVKQITKGVATFDCLDEKGKLYDIITTAVSPSDTLTSRHIDLELPVSDSIYLSFLYEAGGIADMPERDDSLTLSFWSPSEERWYSVWRTGGDDITGFRKVMIPVRDTRFLQKGFRLRFVNYASLSSAITEPARAGNADQWNIDCLLLDAGRSASDTIIHDAAMTLPLRSLVKDYEAMPWRQFRQAYLSVMSPTAGLFYRNNDDIIRNITRYITVRDMVKNQVVRDFSAGATNVDPFTDVSYNAPLLYTYSSSSPDTALFRVTSYLITDDFDPKENDSISFYQRFTDYFAIDDGTAEAGYGINGQGSRTAMCALRYRSYTSDSVAGISICFNDAYDNANRKAFDIMVWADDNGQPGVLLGSMEGPVVTPAEDNNGFMTWLFEEPVEVNGIFWIGWRQQTETFLNAGLDLNTPHNGRQYFMLSGRWQASQAPGTVMIRAVMTGDGTGTSSENGTLFNDLFSVYPNPSTGMVNIKASDDAPSDYRLEIYSLSGSRIAVMPRTERADFSRLAGGTYLLRITTAGGTPVTLLRLVIIK